VVSGVGAERKPVVRDRDDDTQADGCSGGSAEGDQGEPAFDMLTSRQSRISFLARTNYSRQESGEFLSELSAVLGHQIRNDSLLPMDVSDLYRQVFSSGYQHGLSTGTNFFRMLEPLSGFDSVEARVVQFCARFGTEQALLLPTHFEPCIRVTVGDVLGRTKAMLDLDRDTIAIASVDRECGFMLDFNPDDPEWTFELTIWGARWVVT
jgi:hypothetical protein